MRAFTPPNVLPATGFSSSITSSSDHTSAVIRSALITLPHLGMLVPTAGAWNSALHSSGQHNSPSSDACSATSSVAPSMPIKHSNLPRLHKLSASVLTHNALPSILPQGPHPNSDPTTSQTILGSKHHKVGTNIGNASSQVSTSDNCALHCSSIKWLSIIKAPT